MAQVDALRFLGNVSALFAPKVREGQEVTFYIDSSSNSFTVQADNVFLSGGANLSSEEVNALAQEVTAVKTTAESVLNKCSTMLSSLQALSGLITQVETLSGNSEGQTDFAFAYLVDDVRELQNDVADLSASREDSYDSDDISILSYELSELRDRVDTLASQDYEINVNYQFISGTETNV